MIGVLVVRSNVCLRCRLVVNRSVFRLFAQVLLKCCRRRLTNFMLYLTNLVRNRRGNILMFGMLLVGCRRLRVTILLLRVNTQCKFRRLKVVVVFLGLVLNRPVNNCKCRRFDDCCCVISVIAL